MRLTVEPYTLGRFTVALRIPGWCHGAKITINGKPVDPVDMQKGYAMVRYQWQSGDVIELTLPMPVE